MILTIDDNRDAEVVKDRSVFDLALTDVRPSIVSCHIIEKERVVSQMTHTCSSWGERDGERQGWREKEKKRSKARDKHKKTVNLYLCFRSTEEILTSVFRVLMQHCAQ